MPEPLPPTAKTVLIAVNPVAGAGVRHGIIDPLIDELSRRGLDARRVSSIAQLTFESEQAIARGELRAVVAAGGDGTAAEIVNRTPIGTPVAVLPLGTENLLAKHLRMHGDPASLAAAIEQGNTVWLDAGRANGRLFVLMASVGFDADVVHRVDAARDGHITHWSYAKPILDAIRSYQYPELRVYCAPSEASAVPAEPIRCRWAFAFNLPRYGGGLKFAPQADGADGQLDLCTFRRGGLAAGLKYLAAVVMGRHGRMREFTNMRVQRLRIESDSPVPYEIDGDPGGVLPVEIEVVPRRVHVVVPPAGGVYSHRLT